MEIDVLGIIYTTFNNFFQSDFFVYLKILSAFVSVVLFLDIILLLSKRVRADWRVALYGEAKVRFKKSKYNPRWEAIERRLEEGSISSGKVALFEADKLLLEALGILGYPGENISEKIDNVKSGQLVGIEDVKSAHNLFQKIMEDPAYEADFDEIKSSVLAFGRVFRGIGMIG